MKKKDSSGNTVYYYYKKKVGRHKKPGRKKKPKTRGRRWQEPWDFKIILCRDKKQIKYVGVFHTAEEANYVKQMLIKENDSVEFPKKCINNGRKNKKIYEINEEYLILKKIRNTDLESNVTKLRNQYGAFVEHTTTSKNWLIYDKFPRVVEETFWVYGYNPKTDRKTFGWIFDNLIKAYSEEKNNIVLIYLFGNKVIFKYEDDFNFIICKNKSDAIRFYNKIEEKSKKLKNIMLTGFSTLKDQRGQNTREMLAQKTGWTDKKICTSTTRA